MALTAQSVDPRGDGSQVERPDYRVDFWRATHSSEYILTGADDICEVMAWAKANADGREFVIYAVARNDEDGRGLVRLFGNEPAALWQSSGSG